MSLYAEHFGDLNPVWMTEALPEDEIITIESLPTFLMYKGGKALGLLDSHDATGWRLEEWVKQLHQQ